jgi:hypothetical protein
LASPFIELIFLYRVGIIIPSFESKEKVRSRLENAQLALLNFPKGTLFNRESPFPVPLLRS